ncbi:class I SAM-dependent methyltransferase [Streptomyces sp. LHD-70]|uniref:class I SAM-dependent methyltransferase n=1 Tax=Streptomyces sp. LHD-70 TaxID=3072140 RepID=UPI0028104D81|nr:class I SAM-dependent methyltransferase [Streptomyces sp. LHD-70]MDQ8705974.1 class I SAM-dependent methyltransferase [Streptomyces sp. LHD-70]
MTDLFTPTATVADDTAPTGYGSCEDRPAPPDPARILDLSWGIARTGTLVAALELDVFSLIAAGTRTVPALAESTGTNERAMGLLTGALNALGLLVRQRDGGYRLPADSAAFLVRGAPNYLGDLRHMHRVINFPLWPRLTEAVRGDRPFDDLFGDDGSRVWEQVTPYLDQLGGAAAPWLAQALREAAPGLPAEPSLLDAGCGSGGYTRALARLLNARAVGLDRPDVAKLAAEQTEAAGLSEKVTFRGGELRELDWGTSYDLALLSNLLHGYSENEALSLLRRARAALRPGGTVAVFEFVPDVERPMDNPVAGFFSLQMLLTSEGSGYALDEYQGWLREAGFTKVAARRCPAGPQTLITAVVPETA